MKEMSLKQGGKLTTDLVGKDAEASLTEGNEGGVAARGLPRRAVRTAGAQRGEVPVRIQEEKADEAGESGEKRREEEGGGDATITRSGGEEAETGPALTASVSKTASVSYVGQSDNMRTDRVLNVEVDGAEKITMMELLKAVSGSCGRVIGCRQKGERRCELLMKSDGGKEKLLDGFKIKGCNVLAYGATKNERIVSFLSLPIYTTDAEIWAKLRDWKVEPVSPIRRRKWPETDIYDGTRFLKVRFPDSVSSLPYSTRFETLEGVEYFRVIHDQQKKVCRLCLQPGHILRDCDEFKCHKCHRVGHYARECWFGAAARTRTEGRSELRWDTSPYEREEEEVTLVEEAAAEMEQEQTGGDEREGMEEEMEEGEEAVEEEAPGTEETQTDLQPSEQPVSEAGRAADQQTAESEVQELTSESEVTGSRKEGESAANGLNGEPVIKEQQSTPRLSQTPQQVQTPAQPVVKAASTHPKPTPEGGQKYKKIFGTMRMEQQSTGDHQTQAQESSEEQHQAPTPAADLPVRTQQPKPAQSRGGQKISGAPSIIKPATLQEPTKQSAKQPDETAAMEKKEEEAEDSEVLKAFNSGVEGAITRQRERREEEVTSRQRSRSSRRGERGRPLGGGQKAPSSDSDREVAGQPRGRGAKRKEKKKS